MKTLMKMAFTFLSITLGVLVSHQASAQTAEYHFSLVSQNFTPSSDSSSIRNAIEGKLDFQVYAYEDLTDVTMEFRLAENGARFYVRNDQVKIPGDYPADLSIPKVERIEHGLLVKIEKLNVLLHPSVVIGVRPAILPAQEWTSFNTPLQPSISVVSANELPTMLAHPPVTEGKAELEQWISALLNETIVKAGPTAKIMLTVSVVDQWARIPLFLLPATSYEAGIPAALAAAIQRDLATMGIQDWHKIGFDLRVLRSEPSSNPCIAELIGINLDHARVSDL